MREEGSGHELGLLSVVFGCSVVLLTYFFKSGAHSKTSSFLLIVIRYVDIYILFSVFSHI